MGRGGMEVQERVVCGYSEIGVTHLSKASIRFPLSSDGAPTVEVGDPPITRSIKPYCSASSASTKKPPAGEANGAM